MFIVLQGSRIRVDSAVGVTLHACIHLCVTLIERTKSNLNAEAKSTDSQRKLDGSRV